jgi:hypothetical protein
LLIGGFGCSSGSSPGSGNTDAALPAVAGKWTGMWNDTRYNVSGALTGDFTITGTTFNGMGTIDLSQIGLGTETGTASGTIVDNALMFTFSSDKVGNGSTMLKGQSASGSGTVTGTLAFGAFTFSGTATDTEINGTFQFASATGGKGTVKMTKM